MWDGEGRKEHACMERESVQECVRMWTRRANCVIPLPLQIGRVLESGRRGCRRGNGARLGTGRLAWEFQDSM